MADIVAPVFLGQTVDHVPLIVTLVHGFQPPIFRVGPEPAVLDWTKTLRFAVEHARTANHAFDFFWLLSNPN